MTLPGDFSKRLQASQGPTSKGNVAHFRQELGKVFVDVQMTQVRYFKKMLVYASNAWMKDDESTAATCFNLPSGKLT